MYTVVIIPTFNECGATTPLLKQLIQLRPHSSPDTLEVLYVDGRSTDGTAEILEQAAAKHSWVHVLTQDNCSGLGAAYFEGMQHALLNMRPDFILEFDGDLQHRVSDIPKFLQKAQEGFDYIVGSRFIDGGSLPKGWDWRRVALSRVGNFVARHALSLPALSDITSGFKMSRVRGFLDQFDFQAALSHRHAYKIQLLHFMLSHGARTVEVPIVFEERSAGESKLVKNDILDTLRVLFALRVAPLFTVSKPANAIVLGKR